MKKIQVLILDITTGRRGPLHFLLCLAMLTGERFPARLRGGTRGASVVLRLKCSQGSKARTRSPAGGRGVVNTGSFYPFSHVPASRRGTLRGSSPWWDECVWRWSVCPSQTNQQGKHRFTTPATAAAWRSVDTRSECLFLCFLTRDKLVKWIRHDVALPDRSPRRSSGGGTNLAEADVRAVAFAASAMLNFRWTPLYLWEPGRSGPHDWTRQALHIWEITEVAFQAAIAAPPPPRVRGT